MIFSSSSMKGSLTYFNIMRVVANQCARRFISRSAIFSDILTACNSCTSAGPIRKRGEVIRTEMSRSLHDHKKRTDDLVDDLAMRVSHLEACFSHRRDTTERAIHEIRREVRSHKMYVRTINSSTCWWNSVFRYLRS